jgi:methylmalonyl-CoA/ethylmalonyl-CoA epimerase
MMARVIKINHIGILTGDIQDSLVFWRDALGMEVSGIQDIPAEAAQIAFLPSGESELELVMPMTADSGLTRSLEKRGPGVHHICLEVDDIEGMLQQLREKGVMLINKEPKVAADGKKYAFIHPKSAGGVMVELYQLD